MAWKSLIKSKNKKRAFDKEIKDRNANLEENWHDLKEGD
jgi:hypothetical protein